MPEFKDFTFPSSTGKNTIHAHECIPDGNPRGIVQIAHGISEYIERYDGFMRFLAENGFVAVGNDHLGHGGSAPTPEEEGFFDDNDGWERVVEDMNKLHDIVSEEYPGLPYIFFGHSMGSFLTRTYMIKYPDTPDYVILCGTGHQVTPVVKAGLAAANMAVIRYGVHKKGVKLNAMMFGSYNDRYENVRTPFDWVNSDPDEVDKYIEDEKCGGVPTVGLLRDMMRGLGFITNPANIAAMNKETPVLFISGWADPVGEFGKGVKRAFNAFCSAGMKYVRVKLYPGARHELLNEPIKEDVMNDILDWLEKWLARRDEEV
ncbi:MAG: lysophospholipase [Ruminiclostridium sp.]|nr:lysophospholipase [Ruminiclostridium sp.]